MSFISNPNLNYTYDERTVGAANTKNQEEAKSPEDHRRSDTGSDVLLGLLFTESRLQRDPQVPYVMTCLARAIRVVPR